MVTFMSLPSLKHEHEEAAMKKPAIADLNINERKELVEDIDRSTLSLGNKKVLVEVLSFYNDLTEKLKTQQISISKLRGMLLGFKPDSNIKKLLRIQ